MLDGILPSSSSFLGGCIDSCFGASLLATRQSPVEGEGL